MLLEILLNQFLITVLKCQPNDVIMMLICIIQKRQYLQNKKHENAIQLYFQNSFQLATLIFYFI